MTTRTVLRINEVETTGGVATNIMDVEWEFVIKDKVRHTPNVTAGLDIRHFPKYHKITMDFDTQTDIFNAYMDDDGVNPVIPLFKIEYTLVGGATELWTFQASKSYVLSRGELKVEKLARRKTWRVVVICIGTRSVTWP